MTFVRLTVISAAAFALAACTPQTIPDPEPEETTVGAGADSGADTYGDDSFGNTRGMAIEDDSFDGMEELATVIYFEFDSSEIGADYVRIVERHAIQLLDDASVSVRLEGHADERGSREYNIGLGERRAQAVRRLLMLQGASAGQISTVSFGEERPEAFGSDEASYSQNRRVVINYSR
ncbi:MAG: peptidoglycan-associated lipoprotein Pal [Pseudomonadota bacterium]